jgi:hypothetical protein
MRRFIAAFLLASAFVLLNATVVTAEKVPLDLNDYGEVRDGYVKMEALAAALGWELNEEYTDISETKIEVSYSIPLRYEYQNTEGGKWAPIEFNFSVIHIPEREYTETNLWITDLEMGDGFMWSFSDLTELPPYVDDAGSVWVPLEPALAGARIFPDGAGWYQDLDYRGGYSIRLLTDKPVAEKPSAETPAPEAPAQAGAAALARPTAASVLIDGKTVAFDAYNIGGNNYFKLRDLAYALSGTAKQFEVGYDAATKAIALTSGKAYTPVGGEMAGKGAGDKSAAPTNSGVYADGKTAAFTAYNIDGNNYFKLRDIGETFDFGVDWDAAEQTISIDTGKGYTAE